MFNFFEQASLIDVPDVATAERTQGCCQSEQAVHMSNHTLMYSTWQTAFPNCLPKSYANLHACGKVWECLLPTHTGEEVKMRDGGEAANFWVNIKVQLFVLKSTANYLRAQCGCMAHLKFMSSLKWLKLVTTQFVPFPIWYITSVNDVRCLCKCSILLKKDTPIFVICFPFQNIILMNNTFFLCQVHLNKNVLKIHLVCLFSF